MISHDSSPPDDELARVIDHTLLRPGATAADVDRLCAEAHTAGFAAVCVNPVWVTRAARQLHDSRVEVGTVVGFPLGASTSRVKAFEAREAISDGAGELDMVLDIGSLKDGEVGRVRDEIAEIAGICDEAGAVLKVILETCELTDDEKVTAARLAVDAGAGFVKTSTGFGSAGATVHDVALLRETVGPAVGVKAAGGIRTRDDARRMLDAGATRIGTSAGPRILGGTTDA